MLLLMQSVADLKRNFHDLPVPYIKKAQKQIERFLVHRDVGLRFAAASALGQAGVGIPKLRARLLRERNEAVLAEICDGLAGSKDVPSLPALRRIATQHSSALARSYALMAIADIGGQAWLQFLTARFKSERSRRVRASVACAMFANRLGDTLAYVLASLASNDLAVRHSVTNLLRHYAPRRQRPAILLALREATAREPFSGIRDDMEATINALSGRKTSALAAAARAKAAKGDR
jgi:HEAT repeat protein